jgi:hypothetical protein
VDAVVQLALECVEGELGEAGRALVGVTGDALIAFIAAFVKI